VAKSCRVPFSFVWASANCPPPHLGSVTFTNDGVAVEGTVLPIPGTFDP